MRRIGWTLCLLIAACALSAQDIPGKNRSHWDLRGPVQRVKESQYLSFHFKVEGLRFYTADRSLFAGFQEFVFDTTGVLTYHRIFQEGKSVDQYETFEYDSLHRLQSFRWGVGRQQAGELQYQFNKLNRLAIERQYDDTGGLFQQSTYSYRRGKLEEVKTFNRYGGRIADVHYTYDSVGRLVKVYNEQLPYIYSEGYTRETEYFTDSLPSRIRYYDGKNRLQWEYTAEYDSKKRLVRETTYAPDGSVRKQREIRYDRKGNILSEELVNEGKVQHITYRYMRKSNWTESKETRFGDTDFRTFYLQYDAYGNWTEKADYDGINLQLTTREILYFEP